MNIIVICFFAGIGLANTGIWLGRLSYRLTLAIDELLKQRKERKCKHCKMDKSIRNPSGYCDHLYYPDSCKICANNNLKITLC